MRRWLRAMSAFALPLVCSVALVRADSPTAAPAPDPVPLYPENYKVLLENEHVRVLDFSLRKGATEVPHHHPANIAIFLTDVKIEFTLPDGSKKLRIGKAGDVSYSEALVHSPVNVGDNDAHGILIELKQPDPSAWLTATTFIHGLPGHEEDLKQHLLSLAQPTRAEPGAITYDLFQSPTKPSEFMRLEVWSSPQALEVHKQTPHLRASFDKRQREGWTTEIIPWKRVVESAPVAGIERLDPRLDEVIAPLETVERVVDNAMWSEGPLWDRGNDALLFSDVPRNAIYRWSPRTGVAQYLPRSGYTGAAEFNGPEPGSNGLTFDAQGRLVFCQHGDRRIVRRELDGRITVLAERYRGKRLNSPNDLVFNSKGDLYFTDPPFGLPKSFDDPQKEQPFQAVYRLTPGGKLSAIITDLRAPNGIAFSPDETTLYVSNADNTNPVWMAYPVRSDGTVGKGRVFADARAYVAPGEGVPDGLKVDARGNLFGAAPGGVHIFAPDGTRLGRIITGVKTGNVAWGEDGNTLFIAANHSILRLRLSPQRRYAGSEVTAFR